MRRLWTLLSLLPVCLACLAGENPSPTVQSFTPQGAVRQVRQLTARFSAPMVALGDPRRPAPFDIDCAEPGTARWADPHTWVFDFDHDLPSGVACRFKLRSDARPLDGRPLTGPNDFRFNTGGPMLVGALPEDGNQHIDEQQVFVLAPDSPTDKESIRAHARCEITGLAEQIDVDILEGRAREQLLNQRRELGYDYYSLLSPADPEQARQWAGDAMKTAESALLVLQCRRSLPPETEVRLIWAKGIRSVSGLATTEDRVLNFKTRPAFTARLRCQRVNPRAACLPMLPLELSFTAEVPTASLMAARLLDASGKSYPAEPIAADKTPTAHQLRFKGPFPERAKLRIELPTDLRDDAGRTLENAGRFPLPVEVDEYPPLAKFSGDFGIIESKTGGILPVTLRNLEPQVAGQQRVVAAGAGIPGQIKRLTASDAGIIQWLERVKLAGQLRGEWIKNPAGNKAAGAEATEVWKEQTGSTSVFTAADQPGPITVPKPLGAKEFEVIGIPLVQPGFYVVELSSPTLGASLLGESRPRHVATSALVTNLGVHFKWGREGSLVWVTTLDKAQPVADASIQISDYCTGKPLWQGRTGPDGLARSPAGAIPKPHGGEDCSEGSPAPLFVSARTADELGFAASFWNKGIQPGDFNLNVGDYLGPEIAHTVFDRPLFRAGETVSMKHFMRRHTLAGFALPEHFQPTFVEFTHLGSDQQFRLPVAMDRQGIAESIWAIPRDARLGAYQVALTDAQQSQRFESGLFHVEQFRLPTMKAVIQPPRQDLVNPREIPLDLHLTYLNGGGAGQAPVRLRTLFEPRELHFAGYEDFNFGGTPVKEGLSEDSEDEYAEDEASRKPADVLPLTLDATGASRTTLRDVPASNRPRDLRVEMEYQDANGELEAVTRRIPLWPASLNLGLKTDGWVASPAEARFHAVVLDLRGKPVANQRVTVQLFRRMTYSYRKRLIGGFYAYDNRAEITRLDAHCEGRSDGLGFVHCTVSPGVTGEVLLQANTRDAHDNEVSSVTSLWLAGEDESWFDGNGTDRIDLIPEQQEYQPGETARFQVRMPFRKATALVAVEREGVAESFVTSLSGKSPVIEVPVRGAHAPNVYVSLLAVRGRLGREATWWSNLAERLHLPFAQEAAPPPTALVDLGKPAYRLGNAEIRVGWQAHRLEVRVEPDAPVYQPRSTARVRVQVRPAGGGPLPVDAELAVAAVDEALLELKPNPSWRLLDSLMNSRPIEVYTATAQMQVVGKRHYGRKAAPHGGGGGRQAARELFETLLLWKGRVALGSQGEASIDIPLNDSLSAFRVVAVANAGLGLFGTGMGSFQTSQPLMLNSGLPPAVREGDRFNAGFTVRNAGKAATTVNLTARLGTEDAALRLPDPPALRLDIPAGGAMDAAFPIEVPSGARRLNWVVTATASQDQAEDQLKVAQSVLPAVPVHTVQATLAQVDGEWRLETAKPADALPGRGGIEVVLRSHLGDALAGVTDYMRQYPYSCLEQKVSKAITLRDKTLWNDIMEQLPLFMDRDGLLRYFPGDTLSGSDVLTGYVLGIAHAAGWSLPEKFRSRLLDGLEKFVDGRVIRSSALAAPDLTLRKLDAIETLSRYGQATPAQLDSLTIAPKGWPTSAVLDWYAILGRVEGIPGNEQRRREAEQILRARLSYSGATLGFSTERQDALGWLMLSGDVNAVRLLLMAIDEPAWQSDAGRLARGALGRLRRGHWDMTTANAWGALAMAKFSQRFESIPVTGRTTLSLGPQQAEVQWPQADREAGLGLAFPDAPGVLGIRQDGAGKPWALVRVRAALPITTPVQSGFRLQRSVLPVEQKTPGVWTRGDTARIRLEIEAQSDQSWVVLDDPVPAGATILGQGLGRDSASLTRGESSEGRAWLAYEERRQDAYRAYYQFVPKGAWTVEYTVRLNNPGRFVLPPTHIEALYEPAIFADTPNAAVEVVAP